LVLVAAPTGLFAGWLAYWAVRDELRGVSACDERDARDLIRFGARGETRDGRLVAVIEDHTSRFWNLSGTF